MSIKTSELQQLSPLTGAERLLADSPGAGTGLIPFNEAAQFLGGELVKPGSAVGAALENKAAADFSNLPSPQTALYNLGARPGENILHNAIWTRPEAIINQRRKNTYNITGINQYFIDRWIGTYISAVLEEDGLLITSDRTPTFSMYQRVENPQELSGKTVTFSILCSEAASVTMAIRGDTGSGSTNVGGKNLAVDTPGLHTITCTLPPNITVLAPGFLVRAGCRIKIAAAKLELGSQQTLAHRDASGNWVLNDPPPDPALELAKCQRYLQILMYGGYDEAHFAYGSVDTINNQSSVFVPFQLKQTMRTNPTLIVQYMQVDKVRIVGRSLSAYTPSWSSHLETVVSSMATKNQILCRFIMPDTSKLPENYIYEVDALSCPRGEVLLASAEL